MNKDEMIKDMADRMDDYCQSTQECPHFRLEDEDYEITCSICRARSLYNAGYRKLAEDEQIVNTEQLNETLNSTLESGKRIGYAKGRYETAREILKTIETSGIRSLGDKMYGNHYKLPDYLIETIRYKFDLEN